MKQTAVEWLYNNLKSHFEHDGDLLEVVQFSFEQAKEMEKEQQGYSEEDMLNFAWFLIKNVGQYSDDRMAHFEGKYLEKFKNK
jgi:hypothetical protein